MGVNIDALIQVNGSARQRYRVEQLQYRVAVAFFKRPKLVKLLDSTDARSEYGA